MKKIILLITIFLGGCSGMQCLRFAGAWNGGTGEIEYCWNVEKSKKAGEPLIQGSDGAVYRLVPVSTPKKSDTGGK